MVTVPEETISYASDADSGGKLVIGWEIAMFSWNIDAEFFEVPPSPETNLEEVFGEQGKSYRVEVELFDSEEFEAVDMMI